MLKNKATRKLYILNNISNESFLKSGKLPNQNITIMILILAQEWILLRSMGKLKDRTKKQEEPPRGSLTNEVLPIRKGLNTNFRDDVYSHILISNKNVINIPK